MDDQVLGTSFLTAGWLGVAALLWFFPMWVAHKLIPRTRFENKLNLQPLEAARVGCCLTGLWLVANEFGTLIWIVGKGALVPGSSSFLRSLLPEERLQFFVVAVELALGLLLIFGSGRFAILALGSTRKREPAAAEGQR